MMSMEAPFAALRSKTVSQVARKEPWNSLHHSLLFLSLSFLAVNKFLTIMAINALY
jgi:hypothetical protein